MKKKNVGSAAGDLTRQTVIGAFPRVVARAPTGWTLSRFRVGALGIPRRRRTTRIEGFARARARVIATEAFRACLTARREGIGDHVELRQSRLVFSHAAPGRGGCPPDGALEDGCGREEPRPRHRSHATVARAMAEEHRGVRYPVQPQGVRLRAQPERARQASRCARRPPDPLFKSRLQRRARFVARRGEFRSRGEGRRARASRLERAARLARPAPERIHDPSRASRSTPHPALLPAPPPHSLAALVLGVTRTTPRPASAGIPMNNRRPFSFFLLFPRRSRHALPLRPQGRPLLPQGRPRLAEEEGR